MQYAGYDMAEQNSGQERSEQPTEKKLKDSRNKGQVARSRELNTTIAMLASGVAFFAIGGMMGQQMLNLISIDLSLDRDQVFDKAAVIEALQINVLMALKLLAPFMAIMFAAAFVGPLLMGGWSFSGEALIPKMSKLNPLKGLKRVFGVKGVIELIKALAKFLLLGTIALVMLNSLSDQYISLGQMSLRDGVNTSMGLILMIFFVLVASLFVVIAIDVPYQKWDHIRKLKMTRQEVKQESKETEGNPEVRGKMRSLQQEVAQRRMLQEIPDADVVIVNPTHFSVALRYNEGKEAAPRLVAKGVDHLAIKIREIAVANNVPLFSAPPLARSLYDYAELNEEVPQELYMAVAQVLAYIYQVQQSSETEPVERPEELPIPEEFMSKPKTGLAGADHE